MISSIIGVDVRALLEPTATQRYRLALAVGAVGATSYDEQLGMQLSTMTRWLEGATPYTRIAFSRTTGTRTSSTSLHINQLDTSNPSWRFPGLPGQ